MIKETQINRLLDAIERQIVPLTTVGVQSGNKLFGAAVLNATDLSCVVAGTNQETVSPLWHGEIVALKSFFEIPSRERPAPRDCVLLSTHEPCPMCISAIAWSGIPTVHFLFDYSETRDSFAIPHDLQILREVFGASATSRSNRFFNAYCIASEAADLPSPTRILSRIANLKGVYDKLSATYQTKKKGVAIPLK